MRLLPRNGLWRHPEFRKLWLGETISMFGTQVSLLAIPLTATLVLSATPFEMGLLNASEYAPFLLIGLFAGVWVDRMPRRPVLLWSNLGRAALLALIPLALLANLLNTALLCVVMFGVGVLTVFFEIAYQSFLPALVSRDDLVEGNSKLETSRSVAQIAGPGLAGGLISLVAAPLTVVLDVVSFLVSALALRSIHVDEPAPAPKEARASIWAEIGAGLRFIAGQPVLRSLAACTGTYNLFNNILLAVYLLYLTRQLGLSPGLIGLIFSIGSIGALVGAFCADRAVRRFGAGRTIIGAMVLSGAAGLFILAARDSSPLTVVCLMLSQFFTSVGVVVYNINQVSMRQSITPDALLGRMTASMRFVVWGVLPIGALIGGVLGALLGFWTTMLIGIAGQLFAFVWVLLSPLARRQPAAPAEPALEAP